MLGKKQSWPRVARLRRGQRRKHWAAQHSQQKSIDPGLKVSNCAGHSADVTRSEAEAPKRHCQPCAKEELAKRSAEIAG